jgi:hypothetical protein
MPWWKTDFLSINTNCRSWSALAFIGVSLAAYAVLALSLSGTPQQPPLIQTALPLGLLMLAYGFQFWLKSDSINFSVKLNPAQAIQAVAQTLILVHLAVFSAQVAPHAPRIALQLLWAFNLDILLSLWLYGNARLGFGVLPIVFSFNLFLWFQPQVFWLQFLFLGTAVASKHLFTWQRNGVQVHIFNPSAVGMFLASLYILAVGSSSVLKISLAYYDSRPTIFALIFVVGLMSQSVGRTVPVAAGALIGLCFLDAIGNLLFGVPIMNDWITPSIFVGVTLLITDPATTPRNPIGQFVFGLMYAASIALADQLLCATHQWQYLSKIMGVCFLNCTVRWIDSFESEPYVLTRKALLLQIMAYAAFFGLLRLDTNAPPRSPSVLNEHFNIRCR